MPETRAADLTVIIPTRERWDILERTLDGLRQQTTQGFEIVVVVDGTDQQPPALDGVRTIVQERGGPGAARNRGASLTDRRLLLFLGDDMIPTPKLVERHLQVHARHPDRVDVCLGHVEWHPDVAGDRLARWMDWSGAQFDHRSIEGDDAGWGRFYSCNVSLKRSLFVDAGGFDEDFTFDYEDLDMAWRLHQQGLRLWYEPGALVHHLHAYDWERLHRRYQSKARGERLMAAKHDWFEPWFAARISDAARHPRVPSVWSRVVDRVPAQIPAAQRAARARADRWYQQQLAPTFLAEWEGGPDLDELRAYLGDRFDLEQLQGHRRALDAEEEEAADEATFYRTSEVYLYDLTAFALAGTKRPYLNDLRHFTPPGSSLLDYGCGIGTDGLRLLAEGHRVSFADFANPSTEYLRWRLAQRGSDAPVYDIDLDEVPSGFHAAFSLDVIEHVEEPFDFLDRLERRADIVMVNLLELDADDTHLHKPLPISAILDHAASLGILRYRRYYGRSHLVIYRTRRPGLRGRARNVLQRHLGSRLRTSV
jgi:GT2 family glycosyltransferase/2-polyprenyl-3-methyl-5-hydroxy-6-metoxy-1,4-benzoquinol methylase